MMCQPRSNEPTITAPTAALSKRCQDLGRASWFRTRRQPTLQKIPVLKGSSKPYLQVKVQSSRESGSLENGFGSQPRPKVQRSDPGCCKFLAYARDKIPTESRSRRDGGGGRGTGN